MMWVALFFLCMLLNGLAIVMLTKANDKLQDMNEQLQQRLREYESPE